MKAFIKKFLLLSALAYVIIANVNCAGSVVAAAFIPLIGAAAWENTANSTNTFFFIVETENSNTSTFTGNENLIGGGQAAFKGSFTNHDIEFVYDSTLTSKKGTYKGWVNDASTEIKLTSPDGLPAITLRKQ